MLKPQGWVAENNGHGSVVLSPRTWSVITVADKRTCSRSGSTNETGEVLEVCCLAGAEVDYSNKQTADPQHA